MAPGLQRPHHRPLLVRLHPAEHGVGGDRVGQGLVVVDGQVAGVHDPAGVGHPGAGRDRADGHRVVPGDDLEVDALARQVGERVAGVVAHVVLEQDQRSRDQVVRELVPVEPRRRCDQDHPSTVHGLVLDPGGHLVVAGGEDLRGAQVDRAPTVELGGRPLADRGEGNRVDPVPARVVGVDVGDGRQGGVGVGVRRGQRGQHLADIPPAPTF